MVYPPRRPKKLTHFLIRVSIGNREAIEAKKNLEHPRKKGEQEEMKKEGKNNERK